MGETDLDALLIALEELKPHVDPCDCGDCKPITDAAAAIRRMQRTLQALAEPGRSWTQAARETVARSALVPPHAP